MFQSEVSISLLVHTIAQKLLLRYHNQELCTQYAWWVLEAITQCKKHILLLKKQIHLSHEQQQMLSSWISQQVDENIPLAYLIGSVPFINTTIMVEPPILIPRTETEEWCQALIEKLEPYVHKTPLRILDLCTGSGCIAIALAKALPQATIYASDINPQAIALAKRNALLNDTRSIIFVESDLFSAFPRDMHFDLIVSNPPYIALHEWQHLDASVKDWEDRTALVASNNGLALITDIVQMAHAYLKPHPEYQHTIPHLVIEIGYNQGESTKQLFIDEGFVNVHVTQDMQHKDRLVSGCISYEKKYDT